MKLFHYMYTSKEAIQGRATLYNSASGWWRVRSRDIFFPPCCVHVYPVAYGSSRLSEDIASEHTASSNVSLLWASVRTVVVLSKDFGAQEHSKLSMQASSYSHVFDDALHRFMLPSLSAARCSHRHHHRQRCATDVL